MFDFDELDGQTSGGCDELTRDEGEDREKERALHSIALCCVMSYCTTTPFSYVKWYDVIGYKVRCVTMYISSPSYIAPHSRIRCRVILYCAVPRTMYQTVPGPNRHYGRSVCWSVGLSVGRLVWLFLSHVCFQC